VLVTPVALDSSAAKLNDQPGCMDEHQASPATSPQRMVWRTAGTFISGTESWTQTIHILTLTALLDDG